MYIKKSIVMEYIVQLNFYLFAIIFLARLLKKMTFKL